MSGTAESGLGLGEYGVEDTPDGRRGYGRHISQQELEMSASKKLWQADKMWGMIRHGWCVGKETFRGELEGRLAGWTDTGERGERRDSIAGAPSHQREKRLYQEAVGYGNGDGY